jgi:redox-sensitive bicupin YhaK (pirin superfamily)
VEQGGGRLIERIVDFPDFEVWRIQLEAGSSFAPDAMKDYGVLMVIDGEIVLAGRTYKAERALLLPRHWQGTLIPANPAQPLVLLLALPRI